MLGECSEGAGQDMTEWAEAGEREGAWSSLAIHGLDCGKFLFSAPTYNRKFGSTYFSGYVCNYNILYTQCVHA